MFVRCLLDRVNGVLVVNQEGEEQRRLTLTNNHLSDGQFTCTG